MRDLFWLSDEAWAVLEPHLPKDQPGKPGVDDLRVISGILHILKTGGRWRDVSPEYEPAKTIYNRYTRWARRGIWHGSSPRSPPQLLSLTSFASIGPMSKHTALLRAEKG